jgi:hypothetical protein
MRSGRGVVVKAPGEKLGRYFATIRLAADFIDDQLAERELGLRAKQYRENRQRAAYRFANRFSIVNLLAAGKHVYKGFRVEYATPWSDCIGLPRPKQLLRRI